jgi:hypothetical protein
MKLLSQLGLASVLFGLVTLVPATAYASKHPVAAPNTAVAHPHTQTVHDRTPTVHTNSSTHSHHHG